MVCYKQWVPIEKNAESVLRSVENLKKMVHMTRRAMALAHGDRVIEKVEIKREPSRSRGSLSRRDQHRLKTGMTGQLPITYQSKDWDKDANEPSYTFEGRNRKIGVYRTARRVLWGERCSACGAPVPPNRGILFHHIYCD